MRRSLMMMGLLAASTTVDAQVADPVGVPAGARIRVTSAGRPAVVGSFLGATPDTLRIGDERGRVRSVGTAEIGSVDVSVGSPVRGGRVAKGALTGAVILGGLTALTAVGSSDSKAAGDAGFAAVILAPVGALIGGGWAAVTAPEQWKTVPTASLYSPSSVALSPPQIAPAKGSGKRIAIGALLGGAAGAIFVQTQRSSSPKSGQYIVAVVPGVLIGGAIGAIWH